MRASRAHRAAVPFNDAINRRDLESLRTLMTDDHAFIDADDILLSGKDEVLDAWRGFFKAFPAIETIGQSSSRSVAR